MQANEYRKSVIGYAGLEEKIEIFRAGIFLFAFTQTHTLHQGDEIYRKVFRGALINEFYWLYGLAHMTFMVKK